MNIIGFNNSGSLRQDTTTDSSNQIFDCLAILNHSVWKDPDMSTLS